MAARCDPFVIISCTSDGRLVMVKRMPHNSLVNELFILEWFFLSSLRAYLCSRSANGYEAESVIEMAP